MNSGVCSEMTTTRKSAIDRAGVSRSEIEHYQPVPRAPFPLKSREGGKNHGKKGKIQTNKQNKAKIYHAAGKLEFAKYFFSRLTGFADIFSAIEV